MSKINIHGLGVLGGVYLFSTTKDTKYTKVRSKINIRGLRVLGGVYLLFNHEGHKVHQGYV